MPFWTDEVVPRMTDKMLGQRDVMNHRHVAVDGLHGDVVEIGFGSGLNVPALPGRRHDRLHGIEPVVGRGRRLSAEHMARVTGPDRVRGPEQ